MDDEYLGWADATEQAYLVRIGEVTPLELVDAAIRRIERFNGTYNAVIHERFDRAREECQASASDGPFRGVPILLKDWGCHSRGDPYAAGTRYLRRAGFRSDHDSIVTAKLRSAGFVILGRTNTPELAMSMTTEPIEFGPSRNPWDLDRSTGGSSGGSAAAVSAGLVPVAHASDGGGSIRIPASWCGLVGLKPTRGRVSHGPDYGSPWAGGLCDHALTRSVRDSARILDVIAGYVPGDPYIAPQPAQSFASMLSGEPPARLRIGVLDHSLYSDAQVDQECVSAVENVGQLLDGLGHRLSNAYPRAYGDTDFPAHFGRIVSAWCAAELQGLSRLTGRNIERGDIEDHTLAVAERGLRLSAPNYISSVIWLEKFQRRMSTWWAEDGYDILVTPVVAAPPPPLGWLSATDVGKNRTARMVQFVRQFNTTGQPAISLPLHWTRDGLPVGVQLVAEYGGEGLLFQLASQLENAQPWSHRRPVLHG